MREAQQVQGFWERNRDICFWGDGETVGSSCTGEQQAPRVATGMCCKSLKHQVLLRFLSSGLQTCHKMCWVGEAVTPWYGDLRHLQAALLPPKARDHAWRQGLAANTFGKAH